MPRKNANAPAPAERKQKKNDNALTPAERKQLVELYDALCGVASENGEDFFDCYHRRSGAAMFAELGAILQRVAPAEYAAL